MLYELSEQINDVFLGQNDSESVMSLVCSLISRYINCVNCEIWLSNLATRELNLKGAIGQSKDRIGRKISGKSDEFPWRVYTSDDLIIEYEKEKHGKVQKSYLGVPIKTANQTLGSLVVDSNVYGFHFKTENAETLEYAANKIASHLIEFRDDNEENDFDIKFLAHFSRRLLYECSNLEDVYRLATQTTALKLSCRTSSIFLFNKDGDLERRFIFGLDGLPQEMYRRGQSFTGKTAGTQTEFGKPAISNNVGDSIAKIEASDYLLSFQKAIKLKYGNSEDLNHLITVPINGRHRTQGVLRIINRVDLEKNQLSKDGFDDSDIDKLTTIANMVSVAVASLKKTYRQELYSAIDSFIDRDESEMYDFVAKKLAGDETSYSACLFHTFDQKEGNLYISKSSQNFAVIEDSTRDDFRVVPGEGIVGRVYKDSENIIVDDFRRDDKGFMFMDWITVNGFITMICVPLKEKNGSVTHGTLSVFVKYRYKFDLDNILYLQQVADRVSSVISKKKMYQSQKLTIEKETLISKFISVISSKVDATKLFDKVIEEVVEIFGGDAGFISVLTRNNDEFIIKSNHGIEIERIPQFSLSKDSLISRSVNSLKTVLWPNDTKLGNGLPVSSTDEKLVIKQELIAPLMYGDIAIGVIVILTRKKAVFNDSDKFFFEILAKQIGLIIQNRKFYNAALILSEVNLFSNDQKSICANIAQKASLILGTPIASVWVKNKDNSLELHMEGELGSKIKPTLEDSIMHRDDGGITWSVINEAQADLDKGRRYLNPYFFSDLAGSEIFRHPEFVRVNNIKTMISMPIVDDGDNEILGVINAYSSRHSEFFDREKLYLRNLSKSGAIALKNQKLNSLISEVNDSIVERAQIANPGYVAMGFAHDANHTLHYINSMISSLILEIPKEKLNNPPTDAIVSSLTKDTDYLSTLFDQLVSYASSKVIKYQKIQVFDIVQSVLYIFSIKLSRNKIVHDIKYESGDKDLALECVKNQIEQVFINLLNNSVYALKKRSHGKRYLHIAWRSLGTDNIELRVSDNGVGLPDDTTEIFEPWFTTKGELGSGFGLAICKRIIEDNHNGRIWVSPTYDGTTFFMVLPKIQVSGV